jgi:hypothetical protein
MSFIKKEKVNTTLNASDGQDKIEMKKRKSIINKNRQNEMVKKQLELVNNKQVRAVPG